MPKLIEKDKTTIEKNLKLLKHLWLQKCKLNFTNENFA